MRSEKEVKAELEYVEEQLQHTPVHAVKEREVRLKIQRETLLWVLGEGE